MPKTRSNTSERRVEGLCSRERCRRCQVDTGHVERRPARERLAEEPLGRAREDRGILTGRDADRDPGGRAGHERRVPQAGLASDDPRDVDRRLDEHSVVELVGGALVERRGADAGDLVRTGRQLAPALALLHARRRDADAKGLRQPAVAREEPCQRFRKRVNCVQGGAAVVPRVEVALARANLHVECDEAPRGDDELRSAAPLHPAVEDDARVRRPVVVCEEAANRMTPCLLFAVADDAERHGERALRGELLDRLELHPELPLVVGDPPRMEPLAPDLGRERVALPELERVRRLDVVVPVHEHRGRIGWPRHLADDEPSSLTHLGSPAEPSHLAGNPLGCPRHVPGACGVGTDARNREEVAELVEPGFGQCGSHEVDRTPRRYPAPRELPDDRRARRGAP